MGSPVRLSILNPSTCVGLRYGRLASTITCLFSPSSTCHFWLAPGITGLPRLQPQSTQRLTLLKICTLSPLNGTGILTRYPSPTPLGLGLGPTNPTRTDLPSETLDFRRMRFSLISRYSCQHSHFHPLQLTLPVNLLRKWNAPLPLT